MMVQAKINILNATELSIKIVKWYIDLFLRYYKQAISLLWALARVWETDMLEKVTPKTPSTLQVCVTKLLPPVSQSFLDARTQR